MSFLESMQDGFTDEIESIFKMTKTAGFLRAGRRPFKATSLINKNVTKKADMVKLSTKAPGVGKPGALRRHGKTLALVGLGALGMDQATKAKRDWEMGREMRRQQGF